MFRKGEKSRVMKKAAKRDDFKIIKSKFNKDGWRLSVNNSYAKEVVNESESTSYNIIVASFEPKGKRNANKYEQRYILWTDLDMDQIDNNEESYQVTGHQFEKTESNPEEWRISKHTVQKGSISADTKTYNASTEDSGSGQLRLLSSLNCNSGQCEGPRTTCDSYNWGCILLIASSYVVSYSACASCAFGSPSCLACLGKVGASIALPFTCDIGSGCTTETACVPVSGGTCY